MPSYIDQMGRTVELRSFPQRIISLVPSQTELLHDLGLGDCVVGITKFCIHPDSWFRQKTRVGGTKNLDLQKIQALNPDLIIGNKEENEEEQIRMLMENFTVWMSDIQELDAALKMILQVGEITGASEKAQTIMQNIDAGFRELRRDEWIEKKRVAYLIWKDPIMLAGKETFIDHLIGRGPWKNVALELDGRYPEVSLETLRSLEPEIVFLSSEPFPFKEKHVLEFTALFPSARVMPVDGEMFSWYGSRLLQTPAYLQQLFRSSAE